MVSALDHHTAVRCVPFVTEAISNFVSVGASTANYLTVSSGDQELTRELLEWLLSGAHFDLDPVSGLTVSRTVESLFGL